MNKLREKPVEEEEANGVLWTGFPSPSLWTWKTSLQGNSTLPLLSPTLSGDSTLWLCLYFLFMAAVHRRYFCSLSYSLSLQLCPPLPFFFSLASSSHVVLLREHNTTLFVTAQSFPWQPTHGPGMSLCLPRRTAGEKASIKAECQQVPSCSLAQRGASAGVKGGTHKSKAGFPALS